MTLYHGDARAILPTLAAQSVDAMVTDPPAGIAFMGKTWDHDHGGREAWVRAFAAIFRECRRVLKPGGHALVWALPRTSHWTATALEDAGFEVRDVIVHLYGQGFPKSLDVGKALDRAAGAERELIGLDPEALRRRGHEPYTATAEQGWAHNGGKRNAYNVEHRGLITAPATDLAHQWDGWGTALKPASEHWILCRAPLSEPTIAANVARWGTGALNVDGARLGTAEDLRRVNHAPRFKGTHYANGQVYKPPGESWSSGGHTGRWPPNVALSHTLWCNGACAEGCPVALLDAQSGERKSGSGVKSTQRQTSNGVYGKGLGLSDHPDIGGDTGGASRFFYVAKAGAAERSRGLPAGERNGHPTVKPLALMRWLLTLAVPPGGVVLDPFAGSGSTLVAAQELGIEAIGIEQDAGYYATAAARLEGTA